MIPVFPHSYEFIRIYEWMEISDMSGICEQGPLSHFSPLPASRDPAATVIRSDCSSFSTDVRSCNFCLLSSIIIRLGNIADRISLGVTCLLFVPTPHRPPCLVTGIAILPQQRQPLFSQTTIRRFLFVEPRFRSLHFSIWGAPRSVPRMFTAWRCSYRVDVSATSPSQLLMDERRCRRSWLHRICPQRVQKCVALFPAG